MGQRIILSLAFIASFYVDYAILFSGDIEFELTVVAVEVISIGFKIAAAIWLYKDIAGKK